MRRTMLKLSTKKHEVYKNYIRVFWSIMDLILPLSSSTYSIYIKGLDSPPLYYAYAIFEQFHIIVL